MGNNTKYDDVAILVVGFDGYIDVWNHFFKLINKYWTDRPQTYLATSELCPRYNNVITVPAGSNSEWSRRAYNALEQINAKYIILLLEDFFITDYVDNNQLEECLDTIRNNDIQFYQNIVKRHHFQKIKGNTFDHRGYLMAVPRNKQYSINLQPAIWNKDFLMDAIGTENYNAWLFEINNLYRDDINNNSIKFLMDTRNPLHITHAIVQSKYLRKAMRELRKIGYEINPKERPVLSVMADFKYNLKSFVSQYTPKCLVKPVKRIGKMFGFDFVIDRILRENK